MYCVVHLLMSWLWFTPLLQPTLDDPGYLKARLSLHWKTGNIQWCRQPSLFNWTLLSNIIHTFGKLPVMHKHTISNAVWSHLGRNFNEESAEFNCHFATSSKHDSHSYVLEYLQTLMDRIHVWYLWVGARDGINFSSKFNCSIRIIGRITLMPMIVI